MKKIIYLLMSLSFVAFASCSDDKENEQSGSGNVPENSSSVLSSSGKERGHSYVDLGLPSGTLWATCNVGAATPQDYGNYYAWGEITTKETYTWDTYKYGSAGNQLVKYCTKSSYGKNSFTDNKTTLELSDDAAYMNWGGKWRIPTNVQQEELLDECYWVWTSNYNNSNVAGYIVYKAKRPGDRGIKITRDKTPASSYILSDAHIFLPAAGSRYDDNHIDFMPAGSGGIYSSSSLSANEPGYAWYVYFLSYLPNCRYGDGFIRSTGLSVRAVISGDGDSGYTSGDSNGNVSAVSVYKSGTEYGHDYVDLGLTSGTKWATANVGAKMPQDYGNYYAWGEVTTKSYYGWSTSTYKYGSGKNALTKYCSKASYGKSNFTDNKTTLDLSDDAAYVNWSGKWQMPTKAQQDELRNECYWVWTDSYNNSNVKGYIVYKAKVSSDKGVKIYSSKTPSSSYSLSDAHIFMPAAGYCYGDYLSSTGAYGAYWSSSLYTDEPDHSWSIDFESDWINGNEGYRASRYYGQSVRAVFK